MKRNDQEGVNNSFVISRSRVRILVPAPLFIFLITHGSVLRLALVHSNEESLTNSPGANLNDVSQRRTRRASPRDGTSNLGAGTIYLMPLNRSRIVRKTVNLIPI